MPRALTELPARADAADNSASPGHAGSGGLAPELTAYASLASRLVSGAAVAQETSSLVDEALGVWARPGFETFMCLPRLRFEPFPYQLESAARVLRQMQGRAILADEVGLGKTIEAGVVLSELRLRGLADRTLVLVRELRAAIVGQGWDLVIADEAHRLKNPRSASAKLARALQTRYLLLLTATPVENRLADLFQLVSLVRPGTLGTAKEFRARHGARGDGQPARDVPTLRRALGQVMVRHRRSELAGMLPQRLAETICVEPDPLEAELYRRVSERVRDAGRAAAPASSLALRHVQRLAGSSPRVLAPSLTKLGWEDLAQRAAAIGTTGKARALLEILARHHDRGEKVVVFTGFRRTLELLEELVADRGLPAVKYHGGLARRQKDAAIAAFRGEAPILLSTEAAGEGRNLQFCHVMVNFDLPWNPMQIEQRLGRIHRIGQERDVVLTNLAARGTIEERILHVLEAKINLFELVVGELDMILGRIEDELDFESLVFERYVTSSDDDEFASRLECIGDDLAAARESYLEGRNGIDELVAEAKAA